MYVLISATAISTSRGAKDCYYPIQVDSVSSRLGHLHPLTLASNNSRFPKQPVRECRCSGGRPSPHQVRASDLIRYVGSMNPDLTHCGCSTYMLDEGTDSPCSGGVSSLLFPGAIAFLLKIVRILSGVGHPPCAASEGPLKQPSLSVAASAENPGNSDEKPDELRENVMYRANSSDRGLGLGSPRSFTVAGRSGSHLVPCSCLIQRILFMSMMYVCMYV